MAGRSLLSLFSSVLSTPRSPQDFLALLDPVHSSRQLRGIVTRVERPAPGTATISFRAGSGWRAHEAGQWARIGVDVDGVRQWRSYSLSAPAGADPEITVSDIGLVSGTLVRHTKPGVVGPPTRSGTERDGDGAGRRAGDGGDHPAQLAGGVHGVEQAEDVLRCERVQERRDQAGEQEGAGHAPTLWRSAP